MRNSGRKGNFMVVIVERNVQCFHDEGQKEKKIRQTDMHSPLTIKVTGYSKRRICNSYFVMSRVMSFSRNVDSLFG